MARNSEQETGPAVDPNAWMTTFSDLLTLMLTFFVLLLSMSSMDTKSVQTAFSFFPAALGVLEKGKQGEVRVARQFKTKKAKLIAGQYVTEELLQNLMNRARGEGQAEIQQTLTDRISLSSDNAGHFLVNFAPNLRFQPGTAKLLPDSLEQLKEVAVVVGTLDMQVILEGHADRVLARRGPFASPWDLSMARAAKTLHVLKEYGKIKKGLMNISAYGSSRPVVSSLFASERARNERVDIILMEPEESKSESKILQPVETETID